MEATGKIIAALEPKSGVSQSTGKPWKVVQYVLETQESYPRHVVFEVFGEDRLQQFNIQTGEELTVAFDIDAREYNGRWYNQLKAWKVERAAVSVPMVTQPSGLTDTTSQETPFDVLPFDQQDDKEQLPF